MSWSLKGSYVETCSCELMCPCNLSFDHGATYDYCRVVLVFNGFSRGESAASMYQFSRAIYREIMSAAIALENARLYAALKQANDTAADFCREKIRTAVRDPKTADLLAPKVDAAPPVIVDAFIPSGDRPRPDVQAVDRTGLAPMPERQNGRP